VSTGRTRLLADAGLSLRETCRRLALIGEDPARLDAILITHEHSDHVAGPARLAKKLDIPVYISWLTAPAIDWLGHTPKLELFLAGSTLSIGDIEIDSFTIPHDAIDPVGFCFRAQGVKFGLATDLGYVTDSIRFHLRGSDLLLLESNHDLDMLKVGPYPWSVKQRVMSRVGHLSNTSASDFILQDFDRSAAALILGHLSEHNNHPEIARTEAARALESRGLATKLVIAQQQQPTEVFEF
jgi:phosphoribosyl 1,2-cyclic phosphodiesterase